MIRVNVNALIDDFEQAAGSCEIEAKKALGRGDVERATFLAGSFAALDLFVKCRKPEDFGTLVSVEFDAANGEIDG